jgi:hypothetical protein
MCIEGGSKIHGGDAGNFGCGCSPLSGEGRLFFALRNGWAEALAGLREMALPGRVCWNAAETSFDFQGLLGEG